MADNARAKKTPSCPRCGNRLRLRADQLGTQIKCPKCDSVFMVARPGSSMAAAAASESDSYEPEIPLKPSKIAEVDAAESSDQDQQPAYEADWSSAEHLEAEAPHQRPVSDEPDYLELAPQRGL